MWLIKLYGKLKNKGVLIQAHEKEAIFSYKVFQINMEIELQDTGTSCIQRLNPEEAIFQYEGSPMNPGN